MSIALFFLHLWNLSKFQTESWQVWLSWLECCFGFDSQCESTYLGFRFSPGRGMYLEAISLSLSFIFIVKSDLCIRNSSLFEWVHTRLDKDNVLFCFKAAAQKSDWHFSHRAETNICAFHTQYQCQNWPESLAGHEYFLSLL